MSLLDTQSQRSLVARFMGDSEAAPLENNQDGESRESHSPDTEMADAEPQRVEDEVCDMELQYMEQSFIRLSHSPLNAAALEFNRQSAGSPSAQDAPLKLETLLQNLSATAYSTKQLEYRAQGYESLLGNLNNMQCSSKKLDTRRTDLINVVSEKLDRLLAAVTHELESQTNAGTHHNGLRRIHFVNSAPKRYISPLVSASIVLIAIIHCMMGVARDHCNLILKCLRCILRTAADMQSTRAQIFASNHIDPIPTTLPTALNYLGLQDGLDFYVVCPSCDTLYKEDDATEVPNKCSFVNLNRLLCGAELFTEHYRGNHTWKTPLCRFSHEPLECWLARFLIRPDIEDMLESTCPLCQETCSDIWGAWYMSKFPGDGKKSFFECSADELRLSFLVYHDFFNPYTNKIAGKQRSVGIIMMVCLNLPPEVRYDMKNIYVTAMLPGPKEPTLDNINKFLRPVVDNLCEHYDPGVYISKTHKYPKGRKVRSAAPVSSMDIVASRAWAGLGSHSHTCFCSFCNATLGRIDDFNLSHFSERSMEDYATYVGIWNNASSLEARHEAWIKHGVRYSEWSRFPWYNPHTDTLVSPLHWIKNILEKQIRENMGCSTTVRSGRPLAPPPLSRLLTTQETTWGLLAMIHLDEDDFEKTKLPEPMLRFLCRSNGIFEAGLASKRMIDDLNNWRKQNKILHADGKAAKPEVNHAVSTAKAEYYLSRAKDKVNSALSSGSTVPALQNLCDQFSLPRKKEDKKADLMKRLVDYYSKNIKIIEIPEVERPGGDGPILGMERVAEIKKDMKQTNIPSWLKKPPINFATVDHGKLASEEYKSLALISIPITLIRLRSTVEPEIQEYFDHFIHLSVVIRILSYQSLTDYDVSLLEFHFLEYLNSLKRLYPFNSITPVQHLGLHLPYFLRKLGPSTRYSENTCEMFIGMLEEISTNSRIGQLEQTLHWELIMASNLKATTDRWNFSEVLQPYADIIGSFLETRYAGSKRPASTAWHTKHKGEAMVIDMPTYEALSLWTHTNKIRNFTRRLHVCEQLRWGHVVYRPFTESRNDSAILFRPRGSSVSVAGRIEAILQEPQDTNSVFNQPRIIVLARPFIPLSPRDAAHDPYRHHPIVGTQRLNVMGLVYDSLDENHVHVIEPEDIVTQVAVCSFEDPSGLLSRECAVIVDIDMRHIFHS